MTAWRILKFDEVTSTNETILAAGERGEPQWTVHIARTQSRGRGRGSHTWWSPPGRGLWMSVLLRPRSPPRRIGGLSLVAGTAVRSALLELGAGSVDLYWPNDLQFRGRKLGGILGEVRHPGSPSTASSGDAEALVAMGIGLNIDLADVRAPSELEGRIASLAEAGVRERESGVIAAHVLSHLRPLYQAYEKGLPLSDLVGPAMSGIPGPVRVRIPPSPPWEGASVGIGGEGELLVRREGGGVEALRAAEVHYGP